MKTIIVLVDCQNDFMNKNGALYVPGAEDIKPNIACLAKMAEEKRIPTIITCDWHKEGDSELSETPDFKTTFPKHCVAGSQGAQAISEVSNSFMSITKRLSEQELEYEPHFEHEENDPKIEEVATIAHDKNNVKRIFVFKRHFDSFTNPGMEEVCLDYENFIVCGVAADVCVDFVVKGLVKLGKNVIVCKDATAAIAPNASCYDEWKAMGVNITNTKNITNMIGE